ncbi:MAG: hypothetical protein ACJ71U_15795 [Terriglobales bacterium]
MRLRFCAWAAPVFLGLIRFGFPFLFATTVFAADSAEDRSMHLVVAVEGRVAVKHKGWASYAPAVFGTDLRPGDLLKIDENSRVRVVCSDLELHDIPAGITGVPCSSSRPVLQRPDGSIINTTRSLPTEAVFPQVLSPRKTKLLSLQPVLRWTPVAGATRYKVTVRGGGYNWAKIVYSSTEIAYPDEAPKLRTGIDYKLIVETDDNRSSYEPGSDLGFSILKTEDQKRVLQEERRIENLGLPDGPTQFLIARLYASYGLRAEAIEKLEHTLSKFKAAAVPELLGDLYASIGLVRQSETNDLNAIELAQSENDEIGLMFAHLALGRMYKQGLNNPRAAIVHFDSALDLARKLGDNLTATEAGENLAELKKIGMR